MLVCVYIDVNARHGFELRALGESLEGTSPASECGILKDVVQVEAMTQMSVEFDVDHPGATLFQYHQQNHGDMCFTMLLEYASSHSALAKLGWMVGDLRIGADES